MKAKNKILKLYDTCYVYIKKQIQNSVITSLG